MKLCTFVAGGAHRIGVVDGDAVVDLSDAAPDLPREMTALLAAGDAALARAASAVKSAKSRTPLAAVSLAAPILRPPKFLAIGLNYADHIAETGREKPALPTVFNKQSTCVVGPGAAIHIPRASDKVDYEGELAFVIGRRCRHVPRERAHEVIAGYAVANDVTVRDWQIRVPTWTMGKSWDTHGPLGPWITTRDEVGEPHGLRLRTWVSGELRQDSNTKQLIFDCFALVEHLSTAFTLEPGDVISTGTPSGVGVAMKPPKYLVPGDTVRIEIEGLGVLENRVIAEPADTARI
ncbi:MAG TPA: fumarylacetoacetate hydrolase family protein [Myxococcota bacterium]|jgi:2-keto-4-pentenoate hydratase/2-oxohepta-3-ene-1,7-dioic acid hydratase in catechol pathway|nr:fumarylacetoacetate hydrolase family protein [Myxococcota bacterium]